MDLSDRRNHHVITDLKHFKLQRDLLSDLGMLEFIDPEKEYHSQDLSSIGERARLKALDIKKILGITISVAPRWLREARILALMGLKSMLSPNSTCGDKWLLAALASGSATKIADKEFEDQEQANEYCSKLSVVAKLICEALAVEKRFKGREASDSQVHADLCDTVGLKRKQIRQTKAGRVYQITSESWKFASAVLAHRQQQRVQRLLDREKELEGLAQRFQNLDFDEMQSKIEGEIRDSKTVDAPALVFFAEQWTKWIKNGTDQSKPDPQSHPSHPPRLYSISDFSGGGVTKTQKVTSGQKVQLNPLVLTSFGELRPIAKVPKFFEELKRATEDLTIEAITSGRNESYEFHDYLKVKPQDKEAYWVPAEWVTSLFPEPLPVRRDPDAYSPRIPAASLRTWRYWLLGVRSPEELSQFERRRKPKDLLAVVDSLVPEQLETLQQQFQNWGISRDWLPPACVPTLDKDATPDEGITTKPEPALFSEVEVSSPVNPTGDEGGGWLQVEVCVMGLWVSGFWRNAATGEWLTRLGTKPLVAPKEWRLAQVV